MTNTARLYSVQSRCVCWRKKRAETLGSQPVLYYLQYTGSFPVLLHLSNIGYLGMSFQIGIYCQDRPAGFGVSGGCL